MPYEIVTTQFVAHEHDLDAAYALYRERIATSGAEIVAVFHGDGRASLATVDNDEWVERNIG